MRIFVRTNCFGGGKNHWKTFVDSKETTSYEIVESFRNLTGGLKQSWLSPLPGHWVDCSFKDWVIVPAMDIPWGDFGKVEYLFNPNWKDVKVGQRCSIVVEAQTWSDKVCLAKVVPGEQVIRVVGSVPDHACGFPRLTLLDAAVLSVAPFVTLTLDDQSSVLMHPPMDLDDLGNYVEVCSGMACSSFGFAHVGFVPKVAVEIQPKLAALHQQIRPDAITILGDICNPAITKQIWEACPALGTMMSGISCQPYSRGGSMGGAHDSRAQTLPNVLKVAHLLQIKILVIECVVPARTNGFVRQHLRAIHEELGFHVNDATYRLEDVWASCRYRWWVILSHPSLGQIELPPMPSGNALNVRALIPFMRDWPTEDLEQLLLTQEEQRLFTLTGKSLRAYGVNLDQKLPTALHSWGNQCQSCACECRDGGLSETLLATKGVYAQLFPVRMNGELAWRHLHCMELAILTGVPPDLSWSRDQRLNLAAVGQQASPLQAVWVASHALRHVQQVMELPVVVNPADCLHSLKALVLAQANVLYPALSSPVSSLVQVPVYLDDAMTAMLINCKSTDTVGMLLDAEARLRADDANLVAVSIDCLELVPLSTCLSEQPVRLCPTWISAPSSVHVVDALVDPIVEPPPDDSAEWATHPIDCPPTLLDGDTDMKDVPDTIVPLEPQDQAVLLHLSPAQLVDLMPPVITSIEAFAAVRNQTMPASLRIDLLHQQGSVMADDELLWHMCTMALTLGSSKVFVLDPLLAFGFLQGAAPLDFDLSQAKHVVTAVFHAGHWTPCCWTPRNDNLLVRLWEFASVDLAFLNPLHVRMCQLLNRATFSLSLESRSFGGVMCGAACIGFFLEVLLEQPRPTTNDLLFALRQALRDTYCSYLRVCDFATKPWAWGTGPDVLNILTAILQLHGVPASNVNTRAKLIMQSIGKDLVSGAVLGPTPWKSLKQLANQQSPPFQLVLSEELAHKMQAQSKEAPAKRKKKGTKTSGPWALPTELDPTRLSIAHGTFCSGHDEAVPSLSIAQVNPLAVGVALTTLADARPFLDSGKLLTAKGLALLILNVQGNLETALTWNTVRFAATCTLNGEPVLLHGHLVQLGQTPVYPFTNKSGVQLPQVDVACCKLTAHRDLWEGSWEDFCRHPVKHMFALLPPLLTCRKPNCDCPQWHPTATCNTDAVLDVFRRQFCTSNGKPVQAEKSDQYGVMIRYVKAQESQVLQLSGSSGVFVEPRTEDGLGPTTEYQVIWMANVDFETICHKAQCEVHSIGLARTGNRFGIRVSAQHFSSVFASLKPDALFLPPGKRMLWQVGPWPYGVDRKTLAQVFKQWQWDARPTQPNQSMAGGLMWNVQSIAEPPQTVYNLPHGQIVISRIEQAEIPVAPKPNAVGPGSTVKLCQVADTKGVDPLQVVDPWKMALTKNALPMPAPQVAQSSLQELEARLESAILAKLPAQNMEVDDQTTRLSDLEQKFQHLVNRHQALKPTSQQMQSMQAQMMTHMDQHGRQMQGMFEEQMARMESLLNKRKSLDWRFGSRWWTLPSVSRFRARVAFPRFVQFWFWMLLLAMGCRIGEASTPGPTEPTEAKGFVWKLGCCNPSGLHGKQCLVSDLNTDILTVCETHFTARSREQFKTSLRGLNSNYRSVVASAPLEARREGSDAGSYSGVAVLAAHPSRALCVDWPPNLFETSRLQFCTSFVNNVWITGAVCYGYPEGKLHANPRERTDQILHFGLSRLLQTPGPKFFAGDWNHDQTTLETVNLLHTHGWQEVQTLANRMTGCSIQNTCKGVSQKDFVWLSPELVQWFQSLEVLHDVFPDHSVLVASFRGGSACLERFLWPCPLPVDWTSVGPLASPVDFSTADPTDQLKTLWTFKESCAQHALPSWNPKQGGRAKQTKPRRHVGWLSPLKPARTHEFQPRFYGHDIQYTRWIRQLRRLHNFVRWTSNASGHQDLCHRLHGFHLWKSILDSTGFWPSFQHWWPQRSLVCFADPLWIPFEPPPKELAEIILYAFHHEVKLLESRLRQAKDHHRRSAHEANPHLVYKDVKRPIPEPVTTLVQPTEAKVTALDPADCSLILDRPVSLDLSQPIFVDGSQIDPIIADHDQVWTTSLESLNAPATLVQHQYMGSLPALFEAFHHQWRQRWCRHDNLPNAHWDQIVGFAFQVLPRNVLTHVPLDSSTIQAEAFRKKSYAATGLDGISRADVLQACPNTLQSFISMYAGVESSGEWPAQVVAGKVNSLAKVVGASTVGQFRPIVVYSMLYRIWSSVHARTLLSHADQWASPDLYGNRPGRQAAHLWKSLLHDLEHARSHGLPMSGLCCDIEKAYNCLPRWPVVVAAMIVGTPPEILNGWCGAMANMRRHFKIRDNFSDGFLTSTGLAEGCALSCYGMLLIDHLLHVWLQATNPSIRVYSYVDDWSFVTFDPSVAVAQLDAALAFCSMCDLTLDLKKTFGWSLDPLIRKAMRTAGLSVRHFARDLGAHLAFSKQFTNCTVKDRIESLDQFWTSLRSSKCSYGRKVFALRAVGLPRGLYGISSAPLGNNVWLSMRRKASSALGMKKAGVNPLLLLGMVEDACDPQFVATLLTCRDARDFTVPWVWDEAVVPYSLGLLDLVPNSPSRILVDRLASLGLCPTGHGCVFDQFGVFNFLAGNFAEMVIRLRWSWQFFVDAALSHRPQFRGLWNADCFAVRRVLASLSSDKQALYRLTLTGGFFTADAQSHWTEEAPTCKWCGSPDSIRHRVWECVHTLPLRKKLAPRASACLEDLPPALSFHGWAMLPSTWQAFTCALLAVPTTVPHPRVALSPTEWNHVFTDGSCLFQDQPMIRFAAWSAIVACKLDSAWSLDSHGVLGSGPLPGLVQTSFRAELFALAFVLHSACLSCAPVVVWTDCLSVLRRFHLLTKGKGRLKCNTANADLWTWVLRSVTTLGLDRIRVVKVPAHLKVSSATSRFEFWTRWNNRQADHTAKQANLQRDASFWKLWEQHSVETATGQMRYDEIWKLHVAVADQSVRTQDAQTQDEAPLPVRRVPRTFTKRFDLGTWDGTLSLEFAADYGAAMSQRILRWWKARVCSQTNREPQWISLAHMYVDYQLSFGCGGPIQSGKRWLDPLQRKYLEVEKHPFHKRLKWFKRCVKLFCKVHGLTVAFESCRPASDVVVAFVQCASLPWDPWILSKSEHWIASNTVSPIVRDAKAIRALPVARQLGEMLIEH